MKKIFLFTAILIFSGIIWAQVIPEEDSEIPISFKQNVEVCARFNTLQDYEPSLFSASGIYNIWGRRFSASGGFFLQKGDTQLTLTATYKFFKHPKISLATGVIYNLNWLHDFSLTNTFLPCFYLEWQPKNFYTLEFSFDFMFKLRRLFVFGANYSPLINTTVAVYIKNIFDLPKNFRLYINFASFEYFRYMIFCAPSFIFGLEYKINESFDLAFETSIRYIDFFTLSAHYEDTDFRLGVRYKW